MTQLLTKKGLPACQRCKRALKDPDSVARGLGPICAAKGMGDNDMGNRTDGGTVADLPFDPESMDIVCRRAGNRMGPDGGTLHFNISQAVVHHSPTGFEFGYGGSGPADFALNVLALFLPLEGEQECDTCIGYGHFREDGEPSIDGRDRKCLDCSGRGKVPAKGIKCFRGNVSEEAFRLHQRFKEQFIATLPEVGGTISGQAIREWLAANRPDYSEHGEDEIPW